MEVALITPTPLLSEFAGRSSYHLTLATNILEDRAYREYYRYRSACGDYVMLDNCAYELGSSLPALALMQCIQSINPSAMFLPDVRFNMMETLARVEETAWKFKEATNVKLLAVPQGNSLKEVLHCYDELAKNPSVDGFGIYEEIGDVTGVGRRADFLKLLENTGRVINGKTYHCLGMEEDVDQVKSLAQFKWVMGVDSAKPIVYGLHGISLSNNGPLVPYPHRPSDYFERSDTQFRSVIHHNISMVQSWVKDPLANI